MTFQEAHKDGKNGLVTRKNLSQDELYGRLLNYFHSIKCREIIGDVLICDCWTDGKIAITLMESKENPRFIVIADGNYMKLIEP